ncbi:hypothetical protein GGF42_000820 [Coemansia sp. RSA 2424]|nr:hypothetical protein GGF42_000820 [Coemansia sp. RSA 2424]
MASWGHTEKASTEQRRPASISYSVPVTATAESANASGFRASPPRPDLDSSPHMPQNRLSAYHSEQYRRQRGLSDSNYPMLDADPEYRRQQWAADASSPPASRNGRSRSRSNSGGLRAPRSDILATAAAATESVYGDGDKMLQHVPVRSRPLRAQVLAIQERLVQSIADERTSGIHAVTSGRDGRGMARHLRGSSLSPAEDFGTSRTPSPVPKVDSAETLEGLKQLHMLLTTTYAEYSQLRLKIDSHCAEFAPLIDELDSARAACSEATGAALNERKFSEADREEGEEVPGDAPVACALAMTIDPTIEKCAPDGGRLYWAETESGAWLADSADAVIGLCVEDDDPQPARMRKLLPEEARVLMANQAILDRYKELDSGDVRLWVRRYLHLHAYIEQMSLEMSQAHARITSNILAQLDALRDDLGDDLVDDAIAETGGDNGGAETADALHRLTIDSYRDDMATMGATV